MKTFCEDWEKIHSEMEWGRYPSEPVIRFVARNYYKKERAKIRILDFGCGAGANTWFLAREGFDTYGFDGSKSAVDKARRNLEKEGLTEVKLEVCDGGEVDKLYPTEFFNCVIDNACIYANTIESIRRMYQIIYSILKAEGKVFSSCFGDETSGCKSGVEIESGTWRDIKEGILAARGIAHLYQKQELEELLREIGFVNIAVEEMKYTDNGSIVHMYIVSAEKK